MPISLLWEFPAVQKWLYSLIPIGELSIDREGGLVYFVGLTCQLLNY
jgi:hypothetical protein